ncbi:MAG: 6-bladed beta-propeller [Salinivirgaceae bacterium]|nr:6-bladed beta-propeller [Salinivirgaceae bacterium]MBO7477715.1 6-bladed beta-propeller [Salinivirgaceae bacterium]
MIKRTTNRNARLAAFATSALSVILMASCSQGTKPSQSDTITSDTSTVADTLRVYNFSDNAPFDTLRYNNLIESVKFIPLETVDDALLDDGQLFAHKIGDRYVVTSRAYELRVKVFDENGKFLKNGFICGRGHYEIPITYSSAVDEYRGVVIINGFNKVLIFNVNTLETDVFFPNLQEEHNIFEIYPLGANTYAGLDIPHDTPETDKANYPYMFLLDSSFNIVDALRYESDGERKSVLPPPNIDIEFSMLNERWGLSQTQNGLLFRQIYNDTIFFINQDFRQEPAFVINRGKDRIPTFAERKQSYKKPFDKMCFDYVLESQDYIFLSYRNGDEKSAIWHKSSSQMILQSNDGFSRNFCVPASFDGFSGIIEVKQIAHGNTIISAIPAGKLLNVLPGLKEDDNPVVVEIKLKDYYNLEQ